ncbi:Inactive transglutaminase fused to 7 transmembrane helices [Methylomagnum ishizawai]|uniref:Inactive transglutaminase fused to 7 transmembrane helices n=1 Tax=Methylomagnum ishizawai TaxID=1760988 RepID=A0A1Y6D0K6_9GAMM|nr:inactive transglutaminase family protein [Methylomagnum ishizawai]SMF94092.1 Inactive transglutaminase fused to 7 transmembrane helices [Methylomagnum ishizawai]
MRNLHVKILALVLVGLGLSLCWYKVTRLGLPLLPTEKAEVWTVEARIEFKARHDTPIKVQFSIPRQPQGYTVVDENFVSSNYGLGTGDDGQNRQAQWAVRKSKGYQVLYYRIHLARDPTAQPLPDAVALLPTATARDPQFPELIRSAALGLMEEVRSKSADSASFAGELLSRLNAPGTDPNVALLRQDIQSPEDWARRLANLLALANIPARTVHLLLLRDGISHGALTPWLEVYDGSQWRAFNPQTAESGFPKDALIWHIGAGPVLDIVGGKYGKVEYSVTERTQDRTLVAEQRARQMGSRLMEYSMFSLPVGTQNVYRVLLMVPVGAFLIVFLRNVIGLKTFGTFMPILIALAFRETELLWGLILFCVLVGLGLVIRFYLEYLKLLLVPRLASVLIIVILLMMAVSLVSHKLGFDKGLSVALFPMVILAMTIERMSLVWEELGPAEALKQGFGSLFVASLGYLSMSSRFLGHLVFVFPELLLVVLALTLLLGRYTGYRLTELWRFRAALRG